MTINCPRCGVLLNVNISASDTSEQKIEWLIRHPGGGHYISCSSFDEAMDKWFEGFNIPTKVVNDVPEPFEDSNRRVTEYFKNRRQHD